MRAARLRGEELRRRRWGQRTAEADVVSGGSGGGGDVEGVWLGVVRDGLGDEEGSEEEEEEDEEEDEGDGQWEEDGGDEGDEEDGSYTETSSSARKHVKWKKDVKYKRKCLECEVCQRTFTTKKNLERHTPTHLNDKVLLVCAGGQGKWSSHHFWQCEGC